MNKENNRSAAGLRRSAIAERIRLREEWSELKGTDPLTSKNQQPTRVLTKKPQTAIRTNVHRKPVASNNINIQRNLVRDVLTANQVAKSVQMSSEVLLGVVALVEVGAETRALALRAALTALGASVVPAWSPIVTHLVWAQGGCRATRAKARALASRLVSPLWVEACAASNKRLPEQAFPAAARASDLPSPRTLRQLLKKAEMENISLVDLLSDKEEEKMPRLRLSSETELDTSEDKTTDTSRDTSHDTSRDKSSDTSREMTAIESRVNTAPRRALPISISPAPPAKSRRKLFTQKETEETKTRGSDDDSDTDTTKLPKAPPKPSSRTRKGLARAERLARRLVAAATPRTQPASGTVDKPRIVLTGMGRSERQAVSTAIRSLNGRIQAQVTRKTTHVLLGSFREDTCENHCTGITSSHLKTRNVNHNGVTVMKCISENNRTSNVNCDKGVNNCNISGVTNLNDLRLSGVTNIGEPLVMHRSDVQKARTLNALAGAARGCRVLYAQWAMDSEAAGKWIHHHGYEVPHLRKISLKARIERSALGRMRSEYAYDVFNGMKVLISPDTDQKDAAIQLLKLCGAAVVDGSTGQHGGQNGAQFDMTLGNGDGEVSSKWVFDSVAASRMRTTRRYVNNSLSCTVVTQSNR